MAAYDDKASCIADYIAHRQARAQLERYHQRNDADLLDRAIRLLRGLQTCGGRDELQFKIKLDLAEALLILFEDRGTNVIEEAFALVRKVLRAERKGENHVRGRRILGKGWRLRAERWPNPSGSAAEHALMHLNEGLKRAEGNQSDEAILCLVERARALVADCQAKNVQTDLDSAVVQIDNALERLSSGHPLRPYALSTSAFVRFARIGCSQDNEDIRRGIIHIRESLILTPCGYRQRPISLILLAVLFEARYDKHKRVEDLDEAIQCYKRAARGLQGDHPQIHTVNGNLHEVLFRRSEARCDLDDVQNAITGLQRLRTEMPPDHPYRPHYASILARAYEHHFLHWKTASSFDAVFNLHKDAVKKASPSGRFSCLRNLAQAYHSRFGAYGQRADLDKAVRLIKEAKSCCSFPHYIPNLDYLLGDILTTRFSISRQEEDINLAILTLTSLTDGHVHALPQLGVYQSALGKAYLEKHIAYKNPDDLDTAVVQLGKAITLLPVDHYHRSITKLILGQAHHCRFRSKGAIKDIQEAVLAYEDAVKGSPEGHRGHALCVFHLWLAKQALSVATNDTLNFCLAAKQLEDAAMDGSSSVTGRFDAAALLANLAHQHKLMDKAFTAYRISMDLLQEVLWTRLDNKSRIPQLLGRSFDLFFQNAAACAIECHKLEVAVEWLEQKTTIWNISQALRPQLNKLRETNPDLAKKFEQISSDLDWWSFRSDGLPEEGKDADACKHRALAKEGLDLIEKIRAVDGFSGFVKPVTFHELHGATSGGIVIILNISEFRCDALIVTDSPEVQVVPLTNINLRETSALARQLDEALHMGQSSDRERLIEGRLQDILRMLWDVLGCLIWRSIKGFENSHKLHVWWYPTGVLSRLPLHACGPYNGVELGMADLVVSSYITSLSSLLRSKRQRSSDSNIMPFGLLAMGLPGGAPDVADSELPGVTKELTILQDLFAPDSMTVLQGQDLTIRKAIDLIPTRSWLHVSVHGMPQQSPLESHFLVYDGPLHLSRIAQLRLPWAEFAYLSACHSARPHEELPNEALHMTGAFLSAGFRGVVATMWNLDDEDAPGVSKRFYAHLTRKGTSPDVGETAEALHIATMALRKPSDGTSPVGLSRWVPFVHFGA